MINLALSKETHPDRGNVDVNKYLADQVAYVHYWIKESAVESSQTDREIFENSRWMQVLQDPRMDRETGQALILSKVFEARWGLNGFQTCVIKHSDLIEVAGRTWSKPNIMRDYLWVIVVDDKNETCKSGSTMSRHDGKWTRILLPWSLDPTIENSLPFPTEVSTNVIYGINHLLLNPKIIQKTKSSFSPKMKKKLEVFDKQEEYRLRDVRNYVKYLQNEDEKLLDQQRKQAIRDEVNRRICEYMVYVPETTRREHLRHYKSGKVVKVKGTTVRAHTRGDGPLSIVPKKIVEVV